MSNFSQALRPIQYQIPAIQPVQTFSTPTYEGDSFSKAFKRHYKNEDKPMNNKDAKEWQDIGYTRATVESNYTGTNTDSSYTGTNTESNYDVSDIHKDASTADFLSHLGKVESRNNYFARPNDNGYEGKYQFRFRAGDDGTKYLNKMGVSLQQWRKSPKLQEQHMGLVVKDYASQLRSKGISVNNYTLWLRHNQGLAGADNILKGKATPTIKRNLLNQFGTKERARLFGYHGKVTTSGASRLSASKLINEYHKKFKKRFTSTKATGSKTKATTEPTATTKVTAEPVSASTEEGISIKDKILRDIQGITKNGSSNPEDRYAIYKKYGVSKDDGESMWYNG